MAVVITSQFYQAAAWKNISKVVFTSPNIDSPATAGTRSHILPGEGDLGTWYEDTSSMYRIKERQEETDSDYYNFKFSTVTDLNLYSLPDTVVVSGTTDSYDVFYDYMKASVGCTAIGYTPLNMLTNATEYRVKLEYSSSSADSNDDMSYLPNILASGIVTPGVLTTFIYETSTIFAAGDTYNIAWVAPVITGTAECYFEIDFDKPYKVTKIYMKGQYAYDISGSVYFHKRFFGNYTIHGRLHNTDSWTLLYTGANTTNLEASVFLSSTAGFYRYYKITILNNTGLSGFTTTYYALSALQFYVYNYNSTPTRNKAAYVFGGNGEAEVMYVSDVHALSLNTYLLDVVDSTMSGTLSSGTEFKSWGTLSSDVDFTVNDSVTFEVTTGEAYNCRLTAWDDVTHSSTLNELIQGDHVRCSALAYCSTGAKLTPTESYPPDPINYVFGPIHNRILKGNTTNLGYNYYFGDFDLVYRYQSTIYGDFLVFKPMLYGIDETISYGVHDFIITLHYSYT